MQTKPHVFIALATFKDVPIEFLETMVSLVAYTQAQGFLVTFSYDQRTHRNVARENLLAQARELMVDYVFFIDDDMVVPQDIIVRLAKHDVPVVSGLAFARREPFLPIILLNHHYPNPDVPGGVVERYETWFDYPEDQLVQVAGTGLAATLIRNDALEALSDYACTSKEGASEDIQLMRELRMKGFNIYIDTALKVGHMMAERRVIWGEEYDRNLYKDKWANIS